MSALVLGAAALWMAWSLLRAAAARRRWREAERLSRCLFAVAPLRGKRQGGASP